MIIEEFVANTLMWAENKNFKGNVTTLAQWAKFSEEYGEYLRAHLYLTSKVVRGTELFEVIREKHDAIGDMYVVAVIALYLEGVSQIDIVKKLESIARLGTAYREDQILIGLAADHAHAMTCILKGHTSHVVGAIVDTLKTVNALAKSEEFNLPKCLAMAWDEIKDREGKFINGTFVKKLDYVK